jgi:hypothetical protein
MPFTTFDVNIFGTTHKNLDLSNSPLYSREFVIHVLQIECNQTIGTFDMFVEFYAFSWRTATIGGQIPLWLRKPNFPLMDNMYLNERPQVIHLDTMTPNAPVISYPSCFISPAPPCPPSADIRLTSQVFQVPIAATPTGYDTDITDMYNDGTIAKLPVNITIIADGCRYNSSIGTTINIYTAFAGIEGSLGGGFANTNPIGYNEKITIS